MSCTPPCPRCLAGLCHGCATCGGRGGHRVADRRIPGRWVGIVGARLHGRLEQADAEVDALPAGTVVVSGGAPGIDKRVEKRARARQLPVVVLDADWDRWGDAAGPIRNTEVVTAVDELVALPWWGCRGTYDVLNKAKQAALPHRKVDPIPRLEVWTAAIRRDLDDGDLLPTTAAAVLEHESRRRDTDRPAPWSARVAESIRAARRDLAAGRSLVQAQRSALESGRASIGAAWAPPWPLVRAAKTELEQADVAGQQALALTAERLCRAPSPDELATRDAFLREAVRLSADAWERYVHGGLVVEGTTLGGFAKHLRWSYRELGAAWGFLLAQPRVVIGCLCRRPKWWPAETPWTHCHRFLVADALAKCGATYRGEIETVRPEQAALPFAGT